MLSILDILEDTTADGPGFRTSIYAAGCPNACPGCHNPESWDIRHGRRMSTEEILEKVLDDPFADVTFSGGDPMFQPEGFAELARAIKEKATRTSGATPDIPSKSYSKTLARAFCCSISTCWSTDASVRTCATRVSVSGAAATSGSSTYRLP